MRVPLSHVDLAAANIVETDKRVGMAVRLINVGFDPADVISALDLPVMTHTGLPSVQLQNAAQAVEIEGDVADVYPASRALNSQREENNDRP
jgi:hypothetical protein